MICKEVMYIFVYVHTRHSHVYFPIYHSYHSVILPSYLYNIPCLIFSFSALPFPNYSSTFCPCSLPHTFSLSLSFFLSIFPPLPPLSPSSSVSLPPPASVSHLNIEFIFRFCSYCTFYVPPLL